MLRRDRGSRRAIVIARMHAERHSIIRGRVEKGEVYTGWKKRGQRESGESRCAVKRVTIRNATVAIANHSEAATRIAISRGFCRTLLNP